ncbi:MAG TPA: MEDS domain-containing protein [bacterium]|nr:MEDS domain-containing protein [bacterium]
MRTSGDHILVLYEDAPELIASAARFVGDGLTAGKRCQYVGDDAEFPRIARVLAEAGIDADSERRRGALSFMNAVEFARPAPFDRERAAELLRRRTIDAETRRFSGLQIITHATGAFAARPHHPAPLDYEPLMERAVGLGPITVICIYRRDRLDQGALQQLAPVHTDVIANDLVYLSLSAYRKDPHGRLE